jgi:hypothetical protein
VSKDRDSAAGDDDGGDKQLWGNCEIIPNQASATRNPIADHGAKTTTCAPFNTDQITHIPYPFTCRDNTDS